MIHKKVYWAATDIEPKICVVLYLKSILIVKRNKKIVQQHILCLSYLLYRYYTRGNGADHLRKWTDRMKNYIKMVALRTRRPTFGMIFFRHCVVGYQTNIITKVAIIRI